MRFVKFVPAASSWSMAIVNDTDGFIFDYGGVLVHPQTEQDHALMAKIAGMQPEEFSEAYWSKRGDYDLGVVLNVEYWMAVAAGASTTLSEKQIDDLTEYDTVSWMRYDQPMWDWMDELKRAGKRIAMLSNMPLDLGQALKHRSDKLDRFDHVTLSCELHHVKPEPEVYEECLAGIGTEPVRTIFLDDRMENVRGAELLGIQAVQFTSRDEVLALLRG